MVTKLYIDNNVWDIIYEHNIDIINELPEKEFSLYITREAEFEIKTLPKEIKVFVENILKSGKVKTDIIFGFFDENLAKSEQRVGGFGSRWQTPNESYILENEPKSSNLTKRATGLFNGEADRALASRSLDSVVLTCDGKKNLKRAKNNFNGTVIDLKKYSNEFKFFEFISNELNEQIKTHND